MKLNIGLSKYQLQALKEGEVFEFVSYTEDRVRVEVKIEGI